MVVPPFGWSAGDVILSIQLLYRVSKAFKNAKGAQEQYAGVAVWLDSFAHDLDRVREFLVNHSDSTCVPGIKKKLEVINPAYARFEKYLERYQALDMTLSSNPAHHSSQAKRNAKTVVWAFKEMNGHVENLKQSVVAPLAEMNTLLLVQILGDLRVVDSKLSSLAQSDKLSTIDAEIKKHLTELEALKAAANDINQATLTQANAVKDMSVAFKSDLSVAGQKVQKDLKAASTSIATVLNDLAIINARIDERLMGIAGGVETLESKIEHLLAAQNRQLNRVESAQTATTANVERLSNMLQDSRINIEHMSATVAHLNYGMRFQTGLALVGASATTASLLIGCLRRQSQTPFPAKDRLTCSRPPLESSTNQTRRNILDTSENVMMSSDRHHRRDIVQLPDFFRRPEGVNRDFVGDALQRSLATPFPAASQAQRSTLEASGSVILLSVGSHHQDTVQLPEILRRSRRVDEDCASIADFNQLDIRGNVEEREELDHRYQKRTDAKKFFVIGRVFAMLFYEDAGDVKGGHLSQAVRFNVGWDKNKGKYSQEVYCHIRRMVVVRERHGYCWCIPINTYNYQGVAKKDLSAQDRKAHCVIHMDNADPTTDPREQGLMIKKPIAVTAANPGQKLHYMSRLNFGKAYSVEWSVKVMNVGRVNADSMAAFTGYWRNELMDS